MFINLPPLPHTHTRTHDNQRIPHPKRKMSQFLRQLGALKVKEVPDFLSKTVTVANVTQHTKKFFAEYKVKYIDPGSPMPIYHVMGGVFVTAYITVWPTEYRHMMAQKAGHH